MGIVYLPIIFAVAYLLVRFGDYFAHLFQARGGTWKASTLKAVLITAALAFVCFGTIPLLIEVDNRKGWLTGHETVQFAVKWTGYTSIWWAVMIGLRARARSSA
ncbi:MAG: hypothetical protein B7Z10_13160 [Rhodobacterales bacterium 32-66-7]|nr:MAG: hypothetical protein B7Z10_13160 [Rhodobacterales bacterium 32-66-7]